MHGGSSRMPLLSKSLVLHFHCGLPGMWHFSKTASIRAFPWHTPTLCCYAFLHASPLLRAHSLPLLFWTHPSRPGWVPLGIPHQPSQSWAPTFFFTHPEYSAPYYCCNLYWHEFPKFPCCIRAALFLYPTWTAYCLTPSRMFSAMIILKSRAANISFFPLRGMFYPLPNYLSHFDLKFTHCAGIKVTLAYY